MSPQEAVARLDSVGIGDPEHAHNVADEILLEMVHPDVRAAYERLVERLPWWACS